MLLGVRFEIWDNLQLIYTINEVKSLQYDCYLQLGLLTLMMKFFVSRFYFIFMMFWVSILKFEMNPMVEA